MTLQDGQHLPPVDGHHVWWTEGGDPAGVPVLMLHGGPGGRSRPEPLEWWQGLPVRWLAIDQRGCGRSTPLDVTQHNDLAALIADMERLRRHLGIERWHLAAGSWGALLALAYWLAHPQRIGGLFLRSAFLGSQAELERYLQAWPAWLGDEGRAALGEDAAALLRLFQRVTRPCDADTGLTPGWHDEPLIADAWARFDDAQAQPGGVAQSAARWSPSTPTALPGGWAVFSHYARHGWFLQRPLLDMLRAARPPELPLTLVHGALDACCDPAISFTLAAWCPGAHCVLVPGGGHRMGQPEMAAALCTAAGSWLRSLPPPRP